MMDKNLQKLLQTAPRVGENRMAAAVLGPKSRTQGTLIKKKKEPVL